MAKIPQYFRQEETPQEPVGERLDYVDYYAKQQHGGLEKAGHALMDIADDMEKIRVLKANSNANDTRRKAQEELSAYEIKVENERDTNAIDKEYDAFVKKVSDMSPEPGLGGNEYSEWLEDQKVVWRAATDRLKFAAAAKNSLDAYHMGLDSLSSIKTREQAQDEAERLITEAFNLGLIKNKKQGKEDYEKAMRAWDKNMAWKTALEMGFIKGAQYLTNPKNEPELVLEDRRSLVYSLRFFADQEWVLNAADIEEQKGKDVAELTSKLDAKDLDFNAISEIETLKPKEQEKWLKRAQKEYKSKPPEHNWSSYNDAEKAVMESHTGRKTKQQALEELINRRYDKRDISNDSYLLLRERLEKDYPLRISEALSKGMDTINRNLARRGIFGLGAKKGGEEQAGRANQALFDWVDKRIADGKEPTLEEIYAEAQALSVTYKSAMPKPRPVEEKPLELPGWIQEPTSVWDFQREMGLYPNVSPRGRVREPVAYKKGVKPKWTMKMPERPKDEAELEVYFKVSPIWWNLSPDMQYQIWTDLKENKMKWVDILQKDYK